MEIRQLDKEVYAGKKFTAQYQTNGYYDIRATGQGFEIKYTPFEAPTEKGFDDVFFGEWLEDPVAFGALRTGSWQASSRVPRKVGTTASASATSACSTMPSAARASEPR